MKGTILARTLLGLAVLTLVGVTALAQDSKSTITINGGRNTVFMGASHVSAKKAPCPSDSWPLYPTRTLRPMIAITRMSVWAHSLAWKLSVTVGKPTKNTMANTTSQ